MTRKQQLKYLLDNYISGNYQLTTFCDEFTRIFYIVESDDDKIDDYSLKILQELASECNRYTPYEEELALSVFFIGDKEMHYKIISAYKQLKLSTK